MQVALANRLIEIICDHAASTYPHECCGLLAGRVDADTATITAVHPSDNITQGDPTRGFEVDPKLRFDVMRALEAQADGTEIIGHYHSHPDHPAEPSKTDLAMVYEPAFISLICASTSAGAQDLGAFRANADVSGFDQLQIITAE